VCVCVCVMFLSMCSSIPDHTLYVAASEICECVARTSAYDCHCTTVAHLVS